MVIALCGKSTNSYLATNMPRQKAKTKARLRLYLENGHWAGFKRQYDRKSTSQVCYLLDNLGQVTQLLELQCLN